MITGGCIVSLFYFVIMKVKTHRECANPECKQVFKKYSSLDKYCSVKCKTPTQTRKSLKTAKNSQIKKISDKRKVKDLQYYALRRVFLEKIENRKCPITGKKTTEVHHKYSGKDRDKYYLITETWLAVSREGHNWIHENPKEAREKGYLF